MRRPSVYDRHLSEIRECGHEFFSFSLYTVPEVQYGDGVRYLGSAASVPRLHRPRPIRFTVWLPVFRRTHSCPSRHDRWQVTAMTPGTPVPGSRPATRVDP